VVLVTVWVRWAEGSEFVELEPKPLLFRRQKTFFFQFQKQKQQRAWLLKKATPQLGSTSKWSNLVPKIWAWRGVLVIL
jgi:hypothetical protein